MMDTDQQPADCDAVAAPIDSHAAAVADLFRSHNRMLVRYLTARLRSEAEATEVAQEAYVRLLQSGKTGTPAFLRGTLFKTATHVAIDRIRHRRVQQRSAAEFPLLEASAGEDSDPARQMLARERTQLLLGFLRELPPTCREVFSLHRLQGLAQRDVAARLGFSERMVRRYVTYALVYCRLRLDGIPAERAQQEVSL